MRLLAIILTVIFVPSAIAKDLGVQGETFDIVEQPIFEMIRDRLSEAHKDGIIDQLNEEFKERVKRSLERPPAVQGITAATSYNQFEYDPTVYADEDYKDALGRVVVPKGQRFNPLEFVGMRDNLYFIDGDNEEQVSWALSQLDANKGTGKIILLNGAPIELMRKHKQRFYFDQKSSLSRQFSIAKSPTKISQKGTILLIEEIPVGITE